MGITAYIPFTKARRQRMFALGYQRVNKGYHVNLQIEYPDGSIGIKPANWNDDIQAYVTDDDERYYSAGEGGRPKNLLGVPTVFVDSLNAGVISTEAAKVSQREEDLEYCDEDGKKLEVLETDDEGEPTKVQYADAGKDDEAMAVAADGGDIELHYRMGPPPEYHGEVIERRLAGYYDPFPVSRQHADQAIENALTGFKDQAQSAKTAIMWMLLGAGMVLGVVFILWLLGQAGGGGGGGGSVVGMFIGGFGLA